MQRFALAGALGLVAALSVGQASAQMDNLGSTGLGDARAQNLPSSIGVNNGYQGPGYGYAPPAYTYGGRSVYVPRHRHRHYRHW